MENTFLFCSLLFIATLENSAAQPAESGVQKDNPAAALCNPWYSACLLWAGTQGTPRHKGTRNRCLKELNTCYEYYRKARGKPKEKSKPGPKSNLDAHQKNQLKLAREETLKEKAESKLEQLAKERKFKEAEAKLLKQILEMERKLQEAEAKLTRERLGMERKLIDEAIKELNKVSKERKFKEAEAKLTREILEGMKKLEVAETQLTTETIEHEQKLKEEALKKLEREQKLKEEIVEKLQREQKLKEEALENLKREQKLKEEAVEKLEELAKQRKQKENEARLLKIELEREEEQQKVISKEAERILESLEEEERSLKKDKAKKTAKIIDTPKRKQNMKDNSEKLETGQKIKEETEAKLSQNLVEAQAELFLKKIENEQKLENKSDINLTIGNEILKSERERQNLYIDEILLDLIEAAESDLANEHIKIETKQEDEAKFIKQHLKRDQELAEHYTKYKRRQLKNQQTRNEKRSEAKITKGKLEMEPVEQDTKTKLERHILDSKFKLNTTVEQNLKKTSVEKLETQPQPLVKLGSNMQPKPVANMETEIKRIQKLKKEQQHHTGYLLASAHTNETRPAIKVPRTQSTLPLAFPKSVEPPKKLKQILKPNPFEKQETTHSPTSIEIPKPVLKQKVVSLKPVVNPKPVVRSKPVTTPNPVVKRSENLDPIVTGEKPGSLTANRNINKTEEIQNKEERERKLRVEAETKLTNYFLASAERHRTQQAVKVGTTQMISLNQTRPTKNSNKLKPVLPQPLINQKLGVKLSEELESEKNLDGNEHTERKVENLTTDQVMKESETQNQREKLERERELRVQAEAKLKSLAELNLKVEEKLKEVEAKLASEKLTSYYLATEQRRKQEEDVKSRKKLANVLPNPERTKVHNLQPVVIPPPEVLQNQVMMPTVVANRKLLVKPTPVDMPNSIANPFPTSVNKLVPDPRQDSTQEPAINIGSTPLTGLNAQSLLTNKYLKRLPAFRDWQDRQSALSEAGSSASYLKAQEKDTKPVVDKEVSRLVLTLGYNLWNNFARAAQL